MKLEKLTTSSRSYDDACATAHALDLIGERWALLVIRELMLGPRRFGDLRSSMPGVSANVLTQRLEGLEAAGVVQRRKLPPPASVQVYELTAWGLEAEPIVLALGKWGVRSPRHDPTLPLSPVALLLSFRAKFEPARARGVSVTLALHLSDEWFTVAIEDGELRSERGAPDAPDATLTGSAAAVAGLIYGKLPLKKLESEGALAVQGERAALKRFAAQFELPPKAGG